MEPTQIPVQINFRQLDRSEALVKKIRKRIDELSRFAGNIMRCDVVVERSEHRRHHGDLYHVRLHITLPQHDIVINREGSRNHAHEDPFVAVRDAFDAARRQLEDALRRSDHRAKIHSHLPHGWISELIPMQDYGRIKTADERDIYFHRNSVLNYDFDKLEEGMQVHFTEEQGDEGPQAGTVHIVHR